MQQCFFRVSLNSFTVSQYDGRVCGLGDNSVMTRLILCLLKEIMSSYCVNDNPNFCTSIYPNRSYTQIPVNTYKNTNQTILKNQKRARTFLSLNNSKFGKNAQIYFPKRAKLISTSFFEMDIGIVFPSVSSVSLQPTRIIYSFTKTFL